MEDFKEIEKLAQWGSNVSAIWKNLENNTEVSVPDNKEESVYYIKQLEYLMEHNQEKYRDKEGEEIYRRIKDYIDKLKT